MIVIVCRSFCLLFCLGLTLPGILGATEPSFGDWSFQQLSVPDDENYNLHKRRSDQAAETLSLPGNATLRMLGNSDSEAKIAISRGGDSKGAYVATGATTMIEWGDYRYVVVNLLTDPDQDEAHWVRLFVLTFKKN